MKGVRKGFDEELSDLGSRITRRSEGTTVLPYVFLIFMIDI